MSPMRPRNHFSPEAGWINDPNGLIRVDGVYHLFYQANRQTLVHGPMHWGHATSSDLSNWTEQPIALYPDEAGQCFSGSAVAAREGLVAAELGAGDGILLFYTAHRNLPQSGYVEDQAVAIADRTLTSFRKFEGNPVLRTPGPLDFRDPKVIWHAETGRWIMVVTHGQSIGVYSSPDALNWKHESTFGESEGRHGSGPWECPDLFPIRIAGSTETAWILIVGLGNGHISGGSGTQYFVGHFDGHRFHNHNSPDTELFMDWGRDYYAAQSFSGLGDEDPLVIAWMSNWQYANHTPTAGFRGSMTLPRQLKLVRTPEGLRLAQKVDHSAAAAFSQLAAPANASVRPTSPAYRLTESWSGPVGATLALSLFGEQAPVLSVERRDHGYAVTSLRPAHASIAADLDFATSFTAQLPHTGTLDIEVFVDHGLVEIGLANGMHWFSNTYFPKAPAGPVRVSIQQS